MRFIQRRDRDERGAAAVEFALVMPILFLLVFGIVDFGVAIGRYAAVSNAAREGVRTASIGGKTADVRAAVNASIASSLPGSPPTVTVTCKTPTGTNCSTFDAGAVSGGTAIVEVRVTRNWITPVGMAFSPNLNLRKTSQMRIE